MKLVHIKVSQMYELRNIIFLQGFFSLIFLPYLYGFTPADIFTIFAFIITVLIYLWKIIKGKNIKISLSIMLLYSITSLYFIITIIGSLINAPESFIISLLVTLRYFLVVSMIFLIFQILDFDYNKIRKYFEYFANGLIASSIFNAIWIILDQIFYYFITPLLSINEFIFSSLNKGLSHGLTNRYAFGNYLVLRSAGLGWDPGGIGPALVICYILSEILGKNKKIKALLLIAIILTLSRSSITVFLVYLIIKNLKNILKIKEHILIVSVFTIFFLFLQSTVFISHADLEKYFSQGTIRHIKYFSELYNLVYAKLSEVLLGYGYRGTGHFFNNYIGWLRIFGNVGIPESTLGNLFLYGGIIGGIYNLMLYMSLLLKEHKFRITIAMLILLYFGYTFENIWTFFLVYYLWFSNFLEKSKQYD